MWWYLMTTYRKSDASSSLALSFCGNTDLKTVECLLQIPLFPNNILKFASVLPSGLISQHGVLGL